jgi:hypothetical protein
MHAPLVVGDRVNFVDDHRFDIAQNRAALFGSEQNVERLGRRHQNVRRPLQHQPTVLGERVASTNGGANFGHQQPTLRRHLQDLAQRNLQIFLNVVAKRLQRRDVENFRAIGELPRQRLAHQEVNAG